jgi:hypothetical protein
LRRIEEMVAEVVSEMEYLRAREQKLRDTNESTNERVKWFAFGTMGMLVGLGVWQVIYLRAYFRFVTSYASNLVISSLLNDILMRISTASPDRSILSKSPSTTNLELAF